MKKPPEGGFSLLLAGSAPGSNGASLAARGLTRLGL
jgi:hypothetical protein